MLTVAFQTALIIHQAPRIFPTTQGWFVAWSEAQSEIETALVKIPLPQLGVFLEGTVPLLLHEYAGLTMSQAELINSSTWWILFSIATLGLMNCLSTKSRAVNVLSANLILAIYQFQPYKIIAGYFEIALTLSFAATALLISAVVADGEISESSIESRGTSGAGHSTRGSQLTARRRNVSIFTAFLLLFCAGLVKQTFFFVPVVFLIASLFLVRDWKLILRSAVSAAVFFMFMWWLLSMLSVRFQFGFANLTDTSLKLPDSSLFGLLNQVVENGFSASFRLLSTDFAAISIAMGIWALLAKPGEEGSSIFGAGSSPSGQTRTKGGGILARSKTRQKIGPCLMSGEEILIASALFWLIMRAFTRPSLIVAVGLGIVTFRALLIFSEVEKQDKWRPSRIDKLIGIQGVPGFLLHHYRIVVPGFGIAAAWLTLLVHQDPGGKSLKSILEEVGFLTGIVGVIIVCEIIIRLFVQGHDLALIGKQSISQLVILILGLSIVILNSLSGALTFESFVPLLLLVISAMCVRLGTFLRYSVCLLLVLALSLTLQTDRPFTYDWWGYRIASGRPEPAVVDGLKLLLPSDEAAIWIAINTSMRRLPAGSRIVSLPMVPTVPQRAELAVDYLSPCPVLWFDVCSDADSEASLRNISSDVTHVFWQTISPLAFDGHSKGMGYPRGGLFERVNSSILGLEETSTDGSQFLGKSAGSDSTNFWLFEVETFRSIVGAA